MGGGLLLSSVHFVIYNVYDMRLLGVFYVCIPTRRGGGCLCLCLTIVSCFLYTFCILYVCVCVCVCVCVFGGGETVRQKDTGKKDTSFVL